METIIARSRPRRRERQEQQKRDTKHKFRHQAGGNKSCDWASKSRQMLPFWRRISAERAKGKAGSSLATWGSQPTYRPQPVPLPWLRNCNRQETGKRCRDESRASKPPFLNVFLTWMWPNFYSEKTIFLGEFKPCFAKPFQDREKTVELNFNRRVENCSVINRFHLKSRSPKQKNSSEEKVSKRVKFNMEKDTGVFLLRGPRFEMEPVYNGTIFNSTVKVQLYGFFSVLKCFFWTPPIKLKARFENPFV